MSGSDIGEAFAAIREMQREKKYSNRISSTSLLEKHGISFISKNNGIHLIVSDRWDFWPSTGKFIDRQTKKQGRGVFNLIRVVKVNTGRLEGRE